MSKVPLRQLDFEAIRASVLDDAFLFARNVCGHRDLTFDSHRPLVYIAAGQTEKLIDILNDKANQTYTVKHIRWVLRNVHDCDWNSFSGRDQLDRLLRFVNIRVFRGSGKSSSITHPVPLWKATRDPNMSIGVFTNQGPKATDLGKQARATVLSTFYEDLFPDRIPPNKTVDLVEDKMRLGGRTRPDRETSIMWLGAFDRFVGYHWDEFFVDDLVGLENASDKGLEDARRFLANMSGFRNPGNHYPIRRVHVGTRYDDMDDDAELRKNKNCLSLLIPIEYYPEAPALDVAQRGIPTIPNWADAEKIKEIFEETVNSPEGEGAMAYMANYWLNPYGGSTRVFPAHYVDTGQWIPVLTKDGKRMIGRPLFDEKTRLPVLDTRKEQEYKPLNPKSLLVLAACDQAVSDDGDDWAVVVIGVDPDGIIYELETYHGKGYSLMLDSLLVVNNKWSPREIGVEKGAMQGTTDYWLKQDPRFGAIASKLRQIPPEPKGKEWRVVNQVAEPLKIRRLFFSPTSRDLHEQAKKFRLGQRKREDDMVDALGMAVYLYKKPSRLEDVKKDSQRQMRSRQQRTGRMTGIYLG